MGRAPCCDKANVKRGPWSPEEDAVLKTYVRKYGTGGNWIALPRKAGLKRCGKSCRLRWLNYLRPDIKHGGFTEEEDNIICTLYSTIGSRWSVIASHLPGRTDNDVKNHWNTKLKKRLFPTKKDHLNLTNEISTTSTPKFEAYDHGYSEACTVTDTNFEQHVNPEGLIMDPSQFPNNFSNITSSQEALSSLSPSSSIVLEQNRALWSDNGVIHEDNEALLSFGFDQSSYNDLSVKDFGLQDGEFVSYLSNYSTS